MCKPNFDDNLLDKIDYKNFNKLWRFVKFDFIEDKPIESNFYDAKTLAYKLTTGKAVLEDFDNCNMPLSWVLNWLGYNAPSFWSGKKLGKVMDLISWCDANKYNHKEIYIKNTLLQLPMASKKGFMRFPPFKKKLEEKYNPDYVIKKYKKTDPFPVVTIFSLFFLMALFSFYFLSFSFKSYINSSNLVTFSFTFSFSRKILFCMSFT
jgi:hypothetical protein